MNVKLSEVTRDTSGLQQTVTYQRNNGRTRREVFCGRTSKELGDAVNERVQQLRRSECERQAKANTET
jgi:hypothetical protein